MNLFQYLRSLFRFHRSFDEIEYQDSVSTQCQYFGPCVVEPCVVHKVHTAEAHCRAYHAHQCAAGYETGCQQCTFFTAFGIEGSILAAAGYVPVDGATHYQRNVQLQWDEHAQRKGKCRYLAKSVR